MESIEGIDLDTGGNKEGWTRPCFEEIDNVLGSCKHTRRQLKAAIWQQACCPKQIISRIIELVQKPPVFF